MKLPRQARTRPRHQVWSVDKGSDAPRGNRQCRLRQRARSRQPTSAPDWGRRTAGVEPALVDSAACHTPFQLPHLSTGPATGGSGSGISPTNSNSSARRPFSPSATTRGSSASSTRGRVTLLLLQWYPSQDRGAVTGGALDLELAV